MPEVAAGPSDAIEFQVTHGETVNGLLAIEKAQAEARAAREVAGAAPNPPRPKDNRTRVVSVRRVSFLHPVRLEKRPHTSWPEEPKHGPVEVTLQPFGVEVAGSLIPWANVAQVDYA